MPDVISDEAGQLKCLTCHSNICSQCNYILSFDWLDPVIPVRIAEIFGNYRAAKVRVSTVGSYKIISYEVNQEYHLTLTKDTLKYTKNCQDFPKLILRTAAGSNCVCRKPMPNCGNFKEVKLFTKTKVHSCHSK